MIASAICIDLPDLKAFSLGRISDTDAAQIEEHLSHCSHCLERLRQLSDRDTLVEAFRSHTVATRPKVDPARVERAIQTATHLYGEVASESSHDHYALSDLHQLGEYHLLSVLGQGGMGVVYEAVDTRLKRKVAIKALLPRHIGNADCQARFLRESRAIAGLDHENIVPIYHVGEDRSIPYFVMPLLSGETLETKWRRDGALPLSEILRVGAAMAQGLAAAHGRGVVHRDVKPGNIWLESRTTVGNTTTSVKLLDFGLAHDPGEDIQLTQQGVLIGTPAYMSPEQANGLPVDARSDLFSLGTVLYVIASGQFPFQGGTAITTLRAIAEKTPLSLLELNPDLPRSLVRIIDKLLAKDPSQRFASAEEVARQLGQVGHGGNGLSRFRIGRWKAIAAGLLLIPAIGLAVSEFAGFTHLLRNQGEQPSKASSDGSQQPAGKDVPGTQFVAQQEKPNELPTVYPVALLSFEDRGSKDLAGKVTDLLFAKLAANDKLYLVDRIDLKKALAEAELNLSGAVKSGEATKVGQLTGAKLIITGSAIQTDKTLTLVAKLIGTETSRTLGVSVEGKTSDDLTKLVDQLAAKLGEKIADKASELVAKPTPEKDRIAALKKTLKEGARPSLFIQIGERHVGLPRIDPAAQTELTLFAKETGFTVIDDEDGRKSKADYIVKGEGISETATRNGNLITVKTRVEVKVVDRKTDKVVAVDRQTVVTVDVAEQIAGKNGLQEAAAQIAERVLPKLIDVK